MTNASRARAALAAALLCLLSGARTAAGQTPANTLTDAERAAGWRLLFDGATTNGWRGYMSDTMPAGWQVVDGALTRVARAADIITTEKFRDFELTLEWKLAERGNSGVFYRAIEGPRLIYHAAPEYQVLDDERHRDGQSPLTSSGANYGINPAPRGVVKPAGEWNTTRIVIDGRRVEHWLNGVKLLEYEFGSEDWKQRVAASKFSEWEVYGKAEDGHIGLQEHGSWVAFRNIKVRVIR